ncbi:lipase-like PAD4 [Eucalyptus grandis]|uniref:lipase-like PAD4 n=1 Tax=Eucalyptus grandis TaxID=71139 RepID=UPI00192E829C|nr:lipase-like PAD4 [Eucalyptus grandis]
MEVESSPYESSEMLASFLASTPFLEESWRLCSFANSAAPWSFVADQRREVGYVAFSGVQVIDGSEPSCGTLVALGECGCEHLFSPLRCNGEDEGAVKVDAGFLRLFLDFSHRLDFRNLIEEFQQKVKMIILTGHSFGATTATLTALWLLSQRQPKDSPISVLYLTFGTPLLGNESLSQAILQERWGESFCNIVSKLDVLPKLFFAPLTSWTSQLNLLLQFWQFAMAAVPIPEQLARELERQNFNEFFSNVKKYVKDAAQSEEGARNDLFWPLGSYIFCSEEGAICLDNATSIVKMMHLMLETDCLASSVVDHLKYGDYTRLLSFQFLKRRDINALSNSSYEAGVFLALQSSGVDPQMARHMGNALNLNSAYLVIKLSDMEPCWKQLEWYKEHCDESHDQRGYYDTFKESAASWGESTPNTNLFRLGAFWDEVIGMAARNELSSKFHHNVKWIKAYHSYRLLAEPLEIADYYRHGMHMKKGHYIEHGRNWRFQILERWWSKKVVVVALEPQRNNNKRSESEYPSFTQDSLFWAKVEEAKDWLKNAEEEEDPNKLGPLLEKMNDFETHAEKLIKTGEVSKDVLAKNSSYTLWAEKWKDLKPKLSQLPSILVLNEMDCDHKEIEA